MTVFLVLLRVDYDMLDEFAGVIYFPGVSEADCREQYGPYGAVFYDGVCVVGPYGPGYGLDKSM